MEEKFLPLLALGKDQTNKFFIKKLFRLIVGGEDSIKLL